MKQQDFCPPGEVRRKRKVHKDGSSVIWSAVWATSPKRILRCHGYTISVPHHSAFSTLWNRTDSPGVPFHLPSTPILRWWDPGSFVEGAILLGRAGSRTVFGRGDGASRREGEPGSAACRLWRSFGTAGVRQDLRGSELTWLKCAPMSEGSHSLELLLTVPPFSFLGAMQKTGGAWASELGSGLE